MNNDNMTDFEIGKMDECIDRLIVHLSTENGLDDKLRSLVVQTATLANSMGDTLPESILYKLLFISDLCINKFDTFALSNTFKNTVFTLRYNTMGSLAYKTIQKYKKPEEEND